MADEIQQLTRVIVVPSDILANDRHDILAWTPSTGARLSGVCRIEGDAGSVVLRAITSKETKPLGQGDIEPLFEWAREEILSAFEANNDIIIFDPVGPEIVVGEGLDSAIRAALWKEEEDDGGDDAEKPLLLLVASHEIIQVVPELYKLNSQRCLVFRSDLNRLKLELDKWYSKRRSRFILRKSRALPRPEPDETDDVSGHFYSAVRFPLLCGVLLLIGLELLLYTALLQVINFYESALRSHRAARNSLSVATHERSWYRCARKLDNLEHKPIGSLPDLSLAKNFSIRLERALKQVECGDIEHGKEEILRCLYEITAPDAVHMLLPESLYCFNYVGRNSEARGFVELVERAVEFLAKSAAPHIALSNQLSPRLTSPRSLAAHTVANLHPKDVFQTSEEDYQIRDDEEKRAVFADLARAYGSTALCLSGGACNAFFHLGVARTLLEKGILPRHLSGASGGALVGSFLATHTDDELITMLNNPALLSRIFDPCSGAGWGRLATNLLTKTSIFDPVEWSEKLKNKVCGTMTFQEAYERTGRSLTIMVFNGDRHTRALNHKTAPDIVIYSAVLASSAIPKLLPAIQLLRKTKSGEIVPFVGWGKFWRDGSFEEELPFEALARVFNASYTVVSQVNPHIAPFFHENRGSAGRPVEHLSGRGWRGGFLSSFLERVLKQDMKKWLQIMDEFRLLPPIFETDFSRLFLGRNFGSVTVVPPIRFRDYLNLVSDPNTARKMNHYVLTGARMTFPKLCMIEDRMRIELALERHLHEFSNRLKEKGRNFRSRTLSSCPPPRSSKEFGN